MTELPALKKISDACVKRFGKNIKIYLESPIYPTVSSENSVKISIYDSNNHTKDIYIYALLAELPEHILNYKEDKV